MRAGVVTLVFALVSRVLDRGSNVALHSAVLFALLLLYAALRAHVPHRLP